MARLARGDLFDPAEVSAFHCMSRCVRRSFLCGDDPYSGRNYDHRKPWIEQRIQFVAGVFGVDILGFAILSNHFHLVLRNRPDVVAAWEGSQGGQPAGPLDVPKLQNTTGQSGGRSPLSPEFPATYNKTCPLAIVNFWRISQTENHL